MFTGLIQSVSKVISIREAKGGMILRLRTSSMTPEVGESVAVNGVCLTVCGGTLRRAFPSPKTPSEPKSRLRRDNDFEVYASGRTLSCTNLSKLAAGSKVNLERALKVGDRIGGHLVQGHVDGVAKVVSRRGNVSLHLSIPQEYRKYLVPNGSIAIDGVSLTIASIRPTYFEVSLIPYTLENTTLGDLRAGDLVNFELDIIGKYLVSK